MWFELRIIKHNRFLQFQLEKKIELKEVILKDMEINDNIKDLEDLMFLYDKNKIICV